jgi:nucleoid-associated protein YgaU
MTEATQQDPAPAARPGRSFAVLALIVVCVAAAAGGYFFEADRTAPVVAQVTPTPPVAAVQPPQTQPKPTAAKPPPVQQAQAQQAQAQQAQAQQAQAQQAQAQQAQAQQAGAHPGAPKPPTPKPGAPKLAAPSVDVVRVDQDGALVMAGRAQPGETLTINSGVTMLGTTTADSGGQWVFLPDASLPSGVHQLSIGDKNAPATDTAAHTTVLLSLPGQAGGTAAVASVPGTKLKSGPMVVLTQGSGPPRLLLAPAGSHPGPVGLDIVQYDDQGRIRFTGHARPGRTVRLYVNDHVLGDASADTNGIWMLAPTEDLPPGIYQLRTDELAAGGKVMARSEVPFARASLSQVLKPGQTVVQPGDCLWTIARHSYGRGIVYTAIFEENRDQIRDPRRIYPGQAFHMPTPAEVADAPPPSALASLLRPAHKTLTRHGERHAKRRERSETSQG